MTMERLLTLNLKHSDADQLLVGLSSIQVDIVTSFFVFSASSSLATEWVKGKTLDQAGELKNTDIAKELCLPPVKLHCSSEST